MDVPEVAEEDVPEVDPEVAEEDVPAVEPDAEPEAVPDVEAVVVLGRLSVLSVPASYSAISLSS